MSEPIFIFVAGITGVFCGMALLYISIKVMGILSDLLDSREKEVKNG